jgi:hypothetical protein
MVFVLQTDNGGLWAFPDEHRAMSYCEAPDIENGEYCFFDDVGLPLAAKLEPAQKRFLGPIQHYVLGEGIGATLLDRAREIRYLENEEFGSVAAVLEYVQSQRRDSERRG